MFSVNVFRRSASSSYEDDEIDAETMWELKQLKPVYDVFAAFIGLDGFDDEKLAPYADGPFVDALTRRLRDSCAETERDCAKRVLFRLLDRAPSLRAHLCCGAVDALLLSDDCGRRASPTVNGVNELLELFAALIRHELVDAPTIVKVFVGFFFFFGHFWFFNELAGKVGFVGSG